MNFTINVRKSLLILTAMFLFSSCAKEQKEDNDAVEKRVLAAHLTVVYKDSLKPLPSGSYVMTRSKGDGKGVTAESAVFVKYSRLNLRDEYDQTNVEEIAKNAGGYSTGNYYGPTLYELGNYSMSKGLEEAFIGKREGANFRVIVPSWASYVVEKGKDRQQATTFAYDFKIVKVIDKYSEYEIDTLERFSAKFYQGLDSLKKGLYFKELSSGTGDSVKAGTSISYNYVGRLLDGFVFDTNIEDTARKYKIYQAGKSYTPLTYEVKESDPENPNAENSLVKGFAYAISNMKMGGKAITFFSSEWGYGQAVKDFGRRQQLHFYIEVLEKKN